MTHKVHVCAPGSERELEVPDNANLREVCLREQVRLYSHLAVFTNCGGRARCGTCRIRILEGAENLSSRSPLERKRLPAAPEGIRLACQTHVRGPVRLATLPSGGGTRGAFGDALSPAGPGL